MDNDREYHDEFSGYKWTPPNPNEIKIKYSKISEAHKRHLERKKRGNWRNGKKAKPRTQVTKGFKSQKKHDRQQKVDRTTTRRTARRRRAGRNTNKKT